MYYYVLCNILYYSNSNHYSFLRVFLLFPTAMESNTDRTPDYESPYFLAFLADVEINPVTRRNDKKITRRITVTVRVALLDMCIGFSMIFLHPFPLNISQIEFGECVELSERVW
jgi:hypothetical protein